MAANVRHESRSLLVRRGQEFDEVLLWENAACKNLDFHDMLPTLQQRPQWDTSKERARMDTESLTLQRLDLPPVVHFSRGSELLVTSIYAAILQGTNTQRGGWLSSHEFLAQADDQWQAVIYSLVSQVRFAMVSGFISLPGAPNPKQGSPSAQQLSHTAALKAVTSRPAASSTPIETADTSSSCFTSIVTCSGYPTEDTLAPEVDESPENPEQPDVAASGTPAEIADVQQPVKWQPGQLAAVKEGGSEVQSLLDSEGLKLGIVSWHAPWIEACLELAPFMRRLAARFPSTAVIHLDVEGSMANKLLAYEKVLTKCEARRKGAKPVVRGGASFPCITVHEPSNLLAAETFCGSNALDDLAKFLVSRSSNLTRQPPEPSTKPPSAVVPTPQSLKDTKTKPLESMGSSATAGQPDKDKSPALSQAHIEALLLAFIREAADGGDTSRRELSVRASNNITLRNGALEFKRILNQAKLKSQVVFVLWKSSAVECPLDLFKLAQGHAEVIFVEAEAAIRTDNRVLAERLGVKSFPSVQGFHNLRLVKTFSQRSWEDALKPLDAATLSGDPGSSNEGESSSTRLGADEAPGGAAEGRRAESTRAEVGGVVSAKGGARDTTFDPPSVAPKPGAKKRLPKGVAIYWPRMPCLRCGCPWWLGEDWDARCGRCDWSAERDGYDDESQPLPKFKAKHAEFTALLQEGRTADYTP